MFRKTDDQLVAAVRMVEVGDIVDITAGEFMGCRGAVTSVYRVGHAQTPIVNVYIWGKQVERAFSPLGLALVLSV